MRCFLGCFSALNHKKPKHLVGASERETAIKLRREEGDCEASQIGEFKNEERVFEEIFIKSVTESKDKFLEKQQSCCNEKKKVTFDLNVKTFEALSNEEWTNEIKERENREASSNQSNQVLLPYPTSHRYQNCETQGFEDSGFEDSDSDNGNKEFDDDRKPISAQEESSESLFSLSIDSRKHSFGAELGDKEVNSPMLQCGSSHNKEVNSISVSEKFRGRSQCIDSVLIPVENVIQWKAVKARSISPLQHQDKENIGMQQDRELCVIPVSCTKGNVGVNKIPQEKNVAVDASLSSWLVQSEEVTTPVSNASSNCVEYPNSVSTHSHSRNEFEDRVALGALAIEDKQVAASTSLSSRRQRTREMPVIGTVGSYWRVTGRIVDSDSADSSSREGLDTRTKSSKIEISKWDYNSTPLGVRLESALDGSVDQR